MLITNRSTFRQYFKTFKDRLGIQFVGWGDFDKILNLTKSPELKYPALWVESPDWRFAENGGAQKEFTTSIVVLMPTSKQLTDDQIEALIDDCETIMTQILDTLEDESDEEMFFFDKANAQIVFSGKFFDGSGMTTGDLAVGCRADIKLIGGYDCE
jgi:hypothetical protein